MKPTVVVGMSGGVDSSAAAWLLKEQGYEVIGVTMQIWQDESEACRRVRTAAAAVFPPWRMHGESRRVIGIPYYVMNFKDDFRKYVMDYFVKEYIAGRTPNPCIACNRYVKWEALLQPQSGDRRGLYCHRSLCQSLSAWTTGVMR